jgi:hypothetical protein
MAQRSLHALTKVFYRSMLCFAIISRVDTLYHGPACNVKVCQVDTSYHDPSCTMWAWVNYHAISHSSEQDTQHIVFQISKQVIPYRTRGGTCCPGVSTPKIWSLPDSGHPYQLAFGGAHGLCDNYNGGPFSLYS